MVEWEVEAAILLNVDVRPDTWLKDIHNTTILATFLLIN